MAHPQEAAEIQSSKADVWYLKEVRFDNKFFRVITQNYNGPCSFIAICNILILRGNIEVLPPTRRTVSYEFLSQLVAEYLLITSPNIDVSLALTVMPHTQKGMDLNPVFSSATTFRPSGSIGAGGELQLFEQVGIPLVHGWLVDPDSAEAEVLKRVGDYDKAVELIAEVDHLTNGSFVVNEDEEAPLHGIASGGIGGSSSSAAAGSSQAVPTTNRHWTEEELKKVQDAIVVRQFLDTTQSQLTYHGLFHLAHSIPPNSFCALFRNSHLSVLYKRTQTSPVQTPNGTTAVPEDVDVAGPSSSQQLLQLQGAEKSESELFTLVTDQVFLNEPSVVWERFEDVDGGWSTFVDSDFVRASPAGGDFAGQSAEQALSSAEAQERRQAELLSTIDPTDAALAWQLQEEERQRANREHQKLMAAEQRRLYEEQQKRIKEEKKAAKKEKKKGDCVIM